MQNALPADPVASYGDQLGRSHLEREDTERAAQMLGRPLRGRSAAAVRCRWGLPAVLRVDPRLGDGTPFPTLFWLACPLARKHVGRLESEGTMVALNERLERDPEFARAYADATARYIAARDELGGPLPGNPGAGGMPDWVKCLHVHYGHWLATGDNPIGAWVAEQLGPLECPAPCVEPAATADVP